MKSYIFRQTRKCHAIQTKQQGYDHLPWNNYRLHVVHVFNLTRSRFEVDMKFCHIVLFLQHVLFFFVFARARLCVRARAHKTVRVWHAGHCFYLTIPFWAGNGTAI